MKQYHSGAGVEGRISQGVRSFGLPEYRYIGLGKVHCFYSKTMNYRKDGQPFTIEWNIAPILDENNNVLSLNC